MTTTLRGIFLLLLTLTCTFRREAGAQDGFERTPFQAIRWIPEINIDGLWYQLCAIDGVPVQEIIEFAMLQNSGEWDRWFAEASWRR